MNLMKKNLLFLCYYNELKNSEFIVKFFDELRDEIICFIDNKNEIKVFSSICPHFGGEIFYKKTENVLACNWHNWKFCSSTGKCLSFPIKFGLNPYDFEINPDNLKTYEFQKIEKKIFIRNEK